MSGREDLVMMMEVQARRMLSDRNLVVELLSPPYVAIGCGKLRVLRVRDQGGHLEILAGYESYERLVS
ncbi:MAG: hypothetical protein M3Z14_02000 [Candidatus Eremiobacteraeota bacterium]|nr:hypothetical protein [Candidatus Eremiobacteraeota bacterium]